MNIAVSDAKARLTDLVRRAEAGEEIVLTRHGHPAVRIIPVKRSEEEIARRMEAIKAIQREAAATLKPGPCAARSQDFLYDDETGLPA